MRTIAILLAYACALAFGTYHTFRPTFDSGFVRIQTERGDGMLNHLLLENSWLALTEPNYCGTLATPPFFFPEPGTLAYSENLFGSAPIYWALRTVTNCELAYIWWQIVCCALNFVSFALVARWLRMRHVVAVTGAFLWAFATAHVDQLKHSQMVPRFYMPFAAYYAIVLVLEPSVKAFNRMLGALFLQCLACIYTGWFLAVGVAVFLPVLVCLQPGAVRNMWRCVAENKWRVLGVLAFWALAMAALFVPYIKVNQGASRLYEDCHGFFPTPEAWLTGPQGSRWYETLDRVRAPAPFECLLFSGFALYGLVLAATAHLPFFRRGARPALWPAALAGVITALVWVGLTFTTSQTGESLWRVVRHVPGAGAIRVVSRISVTVYLFGTIGALLWLSMLLDRMRGAWARAALLVPLLALLLWEQTGFVPDSFDRRDFYPIVERNAERLRGAEVGYVEPRFVDTQGKMSVGPYGEVFGMWVGMRANVPVLNGYSGRAPNNFPMVTALNDDDMSYWLKGKFRGTVRVINSETPGTLREVTIK